MEELIEDNLEIEGYKLKFVDKKLNDLTCQNCFILNNKKLGIKCENVKCCDFERKDKKNGIYVEVTE